jgi:alkylation response protein AidB-like acyl-CoA dehydrogenase
LTSHFQRRCLGVVQRCIALMGKFAKERVTFTPLAERQAVQFMPADSVTEHTMMQLRVYRTALKPRDQACPELGRSGHAAMPGMT